MSATTDKITNLGKIMDELDAIIDHANRGFDIAWPNHFREADELLMIKSEVWTLRKKLANTIDAEQQLANRIDTHAK